MANVNSVIFMGRLTDEVKLSYTTSGQVVANFSLAINEAYKDKATGDKKERTEYAPIVAWGKLAEICGQYLSKGSLAYVDGKMQTQKWEDKEGNKRSKVEFIARSVQFMDRKENV